MEILATEYWMYASKMLVTELIQAYEHTCLYFSKNAFSQAIAKVISCSPQTDGKALVLKASLTQFVEYVNSSWGLYRGFTTIGLPS